ncbi:transcription elongation factor A protein 2 isoform X7 [Cavia porcellus]
MDLLRELKAMPITLHLLQMFLMLKPGIEGGTQLYPHHPQRMPQRPWIPAWCHSRMSESLPTKSSLEPKAAAWLLFLPCIRKRLELPRMPSTPRITTFPPVPITCNAVRNKCREMLTTALQTDHDHVAVGADCERLSAQIEECIFRDVGNTDMKYKNRVRSRISNLKDAKNPELRRNVLCGTITPQQIAVMTSEEMASDELKEIRKAMTKEAIREHQMARTGGTQTDLFTCGKCRKKNCTYTQVQTRSSDEPMTTFVVCNECGNRWKGHSWMPLPAFLQFC